MNLIAIGFGGVIGGLLRYVLEMVIPTPMSLPVGTLVINLVGCFLLGIVYYVADEKEWRPWLRAGLGTGMIGSFTTFATFSLEVAVLANSHFMWSIAYGLISIMGGVVLVMFGEWVARLILRKWTRSRQVTEKVYS